MSLTARRGPSPLREADWRATLPWHSGTLSQAAITLLQPGEGTADSLVEVSGHGFERVAPIRAWWIHPDGSAELVGEGTSDQGGVCPVPLRVPQVLPGYHVVELSDDGHVAFAVFRCVE